MYRKGHLGFFFFELSLIRAKDAVYRKFEKHGALFCVVLHLVAVLRGYTTAVSRKLLTALENCPSEMEVASS